MKKTALALMMLAATATSVAAPSYPTTPEGQAALDQHKKIIMAMIEARDMELGLQITAVPQQAAKLKQWLTFADATQCGKDIYCGDFVTAYHLWPLKRLEIKSGSTLDLQPLL